MQSERRASQRAAPVGAKQPLNKRLRHEFGKDMNDEETTAGEESLSASEEQMGPQPKKAHRNKAFLDSGEARLIRVMCELEEPRQRLQSEGVERIVMFFGSARAKPKTQYDAALIDAEAKVVDCPDDTGLQASLARLRRQGFLIPLFSAVQDTAQMLTTWSMLRAEEGLPHYVVGTGGGPGMMEAANRGAHEAGGVSVGFGISLPFEDRLNPFVTPSLAFEFHYFFTRKFLMSFNCMGLVVAPGGFGTCDELFEIITLMQTGKIKRSIPVILIGKRFWSECINWQAMVDYGMISEADKQQLIFVDSAEEAFAHLKAGLERLEESGVNCAP